MKIKNFILTLIAFTGACFAVTPQTVTIIPAGGNADGGASLKVGSTLQYSVVAHYPSGSPADDNCTAAGGASWVVSKSGFGTVSGTGLYTQTSDPGTGVVDSTYVAAVCAGVAAESLVSAQHVGDTWYQYPTPDTSNYILNSIPLNIVVGAELTVGSAVQANNAALGSTMSPFYRSCNWSSSAPSVAAVDSIGHVTGVSAGTATITCGRIGDAVFGSSSASGWTSPGTTVAVTVVSVPATSPQTWYVRPNGGTIYNATTSPFGQCTGLTDADYTGPSHTFWASGHIYALNALVINRNGHTWKATTAGTSGTSEPSWAASPITDGTVVWADQGAYPINQACALDNARDLWADNFQFEVKQWNSNFHGGDTVIIRQNSIGYNGNLDEPSPAVGGNVWIPVNCAGDQFCGAPTVPSGNATHHTHILGENDPRITGNSTSCRSDAAKTIMDVTYDGAFGFNITDSQYVDIGCMYISDRSNCGDAPGGAFPVVCHNSPLDFGRFAFQQSAATSQDNITDVFMDGLGISGIFGASGDATLVYDHDRIRGSGTGTINMDDSPWQSGNISVSGGLTLTNTSVEWSGCTLEYPIAHQYPISYCLDQQLGGYGDGLGTGSTSGDWFFDHDNWLYNWQDGLDLLHSGMRNLTVTNNKSIANIGQAFKLGDAQNVTYQNNIAVTDCYRMSVPIGDQPPASIPTGGVGWCRASAGVVIPLYEYGTVLVQHNIYMGYQDTSYIINTASGWDDATLANSVFQDNVHIGYGNPLNSQVLPGVFFSVAGTFPSGYFSTRTYNQYAGGRGGGPPGLQTGEFIGNPGYANAPAPGSPITDETVFDNITFAVPNASDIQYTGITAGLSTDQNGNSWHVPPSLGAYEFIGGVPAPLIFSGNLVLRGTVSLQ